MRTLILLRGAPGCGKTSFLAANGWSDLAVSFDEVRRLLALPAPTTDSDPCLIVPATVEDQVVRLTHQAVKARMDLGATVFVDATNLSVKHQAAWRSLGESFGYTTLVCDLQGDISDAELLARNARRAVARLPEARVLEMAERARARPLASRIREVAPADLAAELATPTLDLDGFDRVVVVGDIHGCASALMRVLTDHGGLDDPTIAWVFLGDYFDRGPQPDGVFAILDEPRDNVILLEGNHDTDLRRVLGHTAKIRLPEARQSRQAIQGAGFHPDDIARFLTRLRPWLPFTFDSTTYVASHGGIATDVVEAVCADGTFATCHLPDWWFIFGLSHRADTYSGQGSYDPVGPTLATASRLPQFHGHRGVGGVEPDACEGVWNLDGNPDTAGGQLLCAIIDRGAGVTWRAYPTDARTEAPVSVPLERQLRTHPLIRARDIGEGVTSYHFTSRAVWNRTWDPLTTAARGLFLVGSTVVARGYTKFFSLDEPPGYTRESVCTQMTYPVTVREKANGFLALVTSVHSRLRVWTKAGETAHAHAARAALAEAVGEEGLKRLEEISRRLSVTFALEVILPSDPHIVDYGGATRLVLLDAIAHTLAGELVADAVDAVLADPVLAGALDTPRVLGIAHTPAELADLIAACDASEDEGGVLVDAAGHMAKVKSRRYLRLKALRPHLERLAEGKKPGRGADIDAVCAFLRTTGRWGHLGDYLVTSPLGTPTLDLPRLLRGFVLPDVGAEA